jgi:hypothetical protein
MIQKPEERINRPRIDSIFLHEMVSQQEVQKELTSVTKKESGSEYYLLDRWANFLTKENIPKPIIILKRLAGLNNIKIERELREYG